MLRSRGVLVLAAAAVSGAGLLGISGAADARAAATGTGGVWGKATFVPGLGVLNTGGDAEVRALSCTSAGNCAAAGYYKTRPAHLQGFVVTERNGVWGKAIEIPGLGALDKGGQAQVLSLSCASAGNCAASGDYESSGPSRSFVASEKNGVWGKAIEIPGLAGLTAAGGGTNVKGLSCGSAGNCVAGGNYTDGDNHQQGFTVIETNGTWGQATKVPGLEALNVGGTAAVLAVSCGSGRSCVAVGYYAEATTDGDQPGEDQQGFVAGESNGTWGQATEIPGLAALNVGDSAQALSVSCSSPGNCGVGGGYTDGNLADGYGNGQGFVADESNGVWGNAIEVPGLGALNATMDVQAAAVGSISCTAPGDCLAGGTYGQPYPWAFVAIEKNGVWGNASDVPGLQNIVTGRYAESNSVSCASPGNCAAGGDFENLVPGNTFRKGYVVSLRNGRWNQPFATPGGKALSEQGDATVFSVSCGAVGHCTAGGIYTDRHGHIQGFVTKG